MGAPLSIVVATGGWHLEKRFGWLWRRSSNIRWKGHSKCFSMAIMLTKNMAHSWWLCDVCDSRVCVCVLRTMNECHSTNKTIVFILTFSTVRHSTTIEMEITFFIDSKFQFESMEFVRSSIQMNKIFRYLTFDFHNFALTRLRVSHVSPCKMTLQQGTAAGTVLLCRDDVASN